MGEHENFRDWIEPLNNKTLVTVLKFPPLPGGEGRGEGERKPQ